MLATFLLISMSSFQAPATTAAEPPRPDRQALSCRSRTRVGSRIAVQRICKTEDEWRIYDADLEQSRRDIADRGTRGCDVSERTGTAVGQC